VEVGMQPELETFRNFIRKRGLRQTKEREAIGSEIFSRGGHFDVDELYLRMKKKGGVSKPSIYRTIPLLIEAGLITEVYLEDGHMHYEHIYGRDHHCHIRCSRCRKVREFADERLDRLEKEIAGMFGFRPEGHKLVIWGLCPDCARRRKEEDTP
jgi:Fur family ferric uptake transcriptional regulator